MKHNQREGGEKKRAGSNLCGGVAGMGQHPSGHPSLRWGGKGQRSVPAVPWVLPVEPRAIPKPSSAGPHLGTMSNRRTFPSISQSPPQGTIHLHSIFTPLHMFPFQPRIIFYHQITAAIRWRRCDSEQQTPAAPLHLPQPCSAWGFVPPPCGYHSWD